MRTIETKVYKYSELDDDTKQKAINNLSDINVDFEWWESTYDDAENIGVKITAFDLDRNKHCDLDYIDDTMEIIDKIIKDHGEKCDTHIMAVEAKKEYAALVTEFDRLDLKTDQQETVPEDYNLFYQVRDKKEAFEGDFLKSLSEEYASILQKEYEYLTSEKAILETIESNDYEFTDDGKLI